MRAGDSGWLSVGTLGGGAVAIVLLVAFAVWETRVADPMIPPRVLRQRSLMASSVVRGVLVGGMYGYF